MSVLLLISSKADDQAFAAQAAQEAGLSLKTFGKAADAQSALSNDPVTAILAEADTPALYSAFETVLSNTIGLFSDKLASNAIHFIGSSNVDEMAHLTQSTVFANYIQRNYANIQEAGAHYGRILKASIQPHSFGLERFLKAGTKIQTIKLVSSKQKQGAVEAVKNYLIAARFPGRSATVISNAVDELLMNAIFDAPVDPLGKQTLNTTPRNVEIKLEGQSAVEMQVGFDGSYVAISTTDRFGSLNREKLFQHITKSYSEEEYKIKTAVAGAGIGLATVFRSGGSFYFTCEQQSRTEVTVFFKRADNFRDFKNQFRFLCTQFIF